MGGGAGRVALPLALRCREVITVDASPGMGAEFTAAASEAGISNARFVHTNWLEAESFQGDVALTANVTYFVREIVPFIEKLARAARRPVEQWLVTGVTVAGAGLRTLKKPGSSSF